MSTASELDRLLEFEKPSVKTLDGWDTAEAQALRFPQKLVAKAQECHDYVAGLETLEKEHSTLFDFVVRNVISTLDNIQFALADRHPRAEENSLDDAADVTDAVAAATEAEANEQADGEDATQESAGDDANEDGDADVAETADPEAESASQQPPAEHAKPEETDPEVDVAVSVLQSVQRSLLSLLEGLHVVPVDLVGKNYRNVEVNGQTVDDPFQVVETRTQGKPTELPVQEVVIGLWVRTEPGLRVVRQGQVIC